MYYLSSNLRVLLVVSTLLLTTEEGDCHWWSFAQRNDVEALGAELITLCDIMQGLSRNQKALCKRYYSHMTYVRKGAMTGINECQSQFQSHRWNCSTVEDSTVFGKVLEIGSKEVAFAYAIASAGVVHEVARACKTDAFPICGCSTNERPEGLERDWEWGGCGDNTKYAYGFAKEFVDAIERDNLSPKRSKDRARKAMNLHNNEAGRMVVVRGTKPSCRCNGLSGSCSMKTCWSQVPDFKKVGKTLRENHAKAFEMKRNTRGHLRPRRPRKGIPTSTDLIYIEASPDYCRPNPRTGVPGTTGRECDKGSTEPKGCGLLCCGRGSERREVEIVEKCRCKFQWCCRVRCEKCKRTVVKHICL